MKKKKTNKKTGKINIPSFFCYKTVMQQSTEGVSG